MTSQHDKANPPPRDNFNTARTEETTNTWLTPLGLIRSLGHFDLDPCCPPVMQWQTAAYMHHYPDMGCGLSAEWFGRIFLNPPYGEHTFKWMQKFAQHKRGIAIIFARTDTKGFHKHVFGCGCAIYFLNGRVKFHREDRSCPKNGPAAPSCLVAHTDEDMATMMTPDCQFATPQLELHETQNAFS